jgi:hypothetical protein
MLMCTHPKTMGYLAWMEVQHSPSNLWSRRTWVSTWLVGSNSLHFAVLFGMMIMMLRLTSADFHATKNRFGLKTSPTEGEKVCARVVHSRRASRGERVPDDVPDAPQICYCNLYTYIYCILLYTVHIQSYIIYIPRYILHICIYNRCRYKHMLQEYHHRRKQCTINDICIHDFAHGFAWKQGTPKSIVWSSSSPLKSPLKWVHPIFRWSEC